MAERSAAAVRRMDKQVTTVYRWLSLVLTRAVVEAVGGAFKAGGPIWNLVDKTGLDAYNTAWDIATDGALSPKAGTNRRGYDCYRKPH